MEKQEVMLIVGQCFVWSTGVKKGGSMPTLPAVRPSALLWEVAGIPRLSV